MNKALAKLKALKDVYQVHEEVEVGEDLKVTLKLLNSEDETDVHGFAVEKYDQGIAYLYAVKRETLCRAIISMNGTDVPEIVEDENEEGKKEKIVRHIWIRENIISGWNQLLVDQIWQGYSRLMQKVEEKITGSIKKETPESEVNE